MDTLHLLRQWGWLGVFMEAIGSFVRYENPDLSIEVICTNCLTVVGRRLRPIEVATAEGTHVCSWEIDDPQIDSQRGTF